MAGRRRTSDVSSNEEETLEHNETSSNSKRSEINLIKHTEAIDRLGFKTKLYKKI